MAFLQTSTVLTKMDELFGQGSYTSKYDHTDANGNFIIQVSRFNSQTQMTETFDWFSVNPTTGNFVSTVSGLYSGSLIGSEEITMNVSFTSDGTANKLQAAISFPITFDEIPTVLPGNITQSVSYCDTMLYPFITNNTAAGCTIVLNLNNSANKFGAGTLKMNFKISSKK